MKWDEQALRLRRKAGEDEHAMLTLMRDAGAADAIIGFHAQQAVEKLLKALLCHHRVVYRRTHDLVELLNLLRATGVAVPPELQEVRFLGPYAVELRYEDISEDPDEILDRNWAAEYVQRTREWVDGFLGRSGENP